MVFQNGSVNAGQQRSVQKYHRFYFGRITYSFDGRFYQCKYPGRWEPVFNAQTGGDIFPGVSAGWV
jgi:hypothetical protein